MTTALPKPCDETRRWTQIRLSRFLSRNLTLVSVTAAGNAFSRIIDHYETAGGAELADEFYSELRLFLKKAAQTPEGYESGSVIFAR